VVGGRGQKEVSNFSANDERMMGRALELAECGLYTTAPNPRVGCVIARGEHIVGEGFHRRAGEAHAEVLALQAAGEAARQATAYVTLEPHCFQSRTPPCTDALIRAGITQVICAVLDPHPRVNGAGVKQLRAAGIAAEFGLMESAAIALNKGFFKRHTLGIPWVTVKVASSLDGRVALANGQSQWITGEQARADVQQLRARSCAIVTGIGTVLHDNPRLTVRDPQIEMLGRAPLRVVLDSQARLPADAQMLQEPGRTLVYTRAKLQLAAARLEVIEQTGAGERVDLRAVLKDLAARECNEVLIEAGPALSGAFYQQGLVDEVLVYVAPILLGAGAKSMLEVAGIDDMKERRELELLEVQRLGPDIRLRLLPQFN
jgi:diaminohydroxyphosphoribosylaminopyrimidine deaminase/5-amino-6-(5-phosphoribosylamino)uracil reductase